MQWSAKRTTTVAVSPASMRSVPNGSRSPGSALGIDDVVASSSSGPSHGAGPGVDFERPVTVTGKRPLLRKVNAVSNLVRPAVGKKTGRPPDPGTGSTSVPMPGPGA